MFQDRFRFVSSRLHLFFIFLYQASSHTLSQLTQSTHNSTTFGMYPLDPPRASLLARLADHPYPAVPEGFGLPESVWRFSMHPAFVAAVSLGYLVAVKMANAARAKAPPRDRIKDTWLTQAVLAHNAFLALYSAWTVSTHAARC